MKLPNKMNPVHCASKDDTRYVLNSVSIQGDLAIATDGRSLFAVKGSREDEDDARDAIVPKRVALAAWPQGKGKRGTLFPTLNINPAEESKLKTCTVINRDMDKTSVQDIDGTFPNIEKVIPDASKYTQRVGLNVKLLLNIAKCFGDDEIAIHFNAEGYAYGANSEPMIITAKDASAFGILMPLRAVGKPMSENLALGAIRDRIEQREAAERAAREQSEQQAKAIVEAERAAEAARIEADREKTAEWLASNQLTTSPTEQ